MVFFFSPWSTTRDKQDTCTAIIIIRAHEANKDAPVNVHNFQINMILMDGAAQMVGTKQEAATRWFLVPRALNDN